jgi:hypothetical protein
MRYSAFLLCLVLVGCATDKQLVDQSVAVKYKYVVTTIPDEMLEIPPAERTIDPVTATDKDVAKWMIDWERRYQEIERRLKTIKAYQDRKLRELNLPKEDVIKN